MSNWSDTELAERIAANPDLARRNMGNSPLAAPKLRSGTSGRPAPVPPREANPAPKAVVSGDQSNLQELALAMSEDDLQQSIIDLAHLHGWKCAHFRSVKVTKKDGSTFWQTPVAADGEGFVDLVLVRKSPSVDGSGMGRVIFAELKAERGKIEPAQREWLGLLTLTQRVEVFCWRPSDWLSGKIENLLR